ncbi:hypothetical protein HYV81_02030 [Candidatus Woesearchaeota archaeon]|nr:hypothetical protein [Candidatus Woesearchaeota archaeon]
MYVNEHVRDITGISLDGALEITISPKFREHYLHTKDGYHLATLTRTGETYLVIIYEPNTTDHKFEERNTLAERLRKMIEDRKPVQTLVPANRPKAKYSDPIAV